MVTPRMLGFAQMLAVACILLTGSGIARAADEKTRQWRKHGADCQLCYEGAAGLELAVPLWVPLVGIEGAETDDSGETHDVEADPHLEFAIVGEARFRFGPVGVGLSVYGASLGSQVVRSSTGESLGDVDLDAYFGHATQGLAGARA